MVLLSLKSPTIFQLEISILTSCPALHISKIFCIKFSSRHTDFNDALRRKVIVAICHNGMYFWKYVFGFFTLYCLSFHSLQRLLRKIVPKVLGLWRKGSPLSNTFGHEFDILFFWTSNTSYVIWCNGAFCTTLIFAAVMPSKNLKVNRG